MHNKIVLATALSGLLAVTQMTIAMEQESTTLATSTQPLSMQSGRTKRSQSNPSSTLHRSLSVSPRDNFDNTTPNRSPSNSQPHSPRKQEVNPAYLEIAQTLQAHGCLQQQYTGYYTNELDSTTSDKLPIYPYLNSTKISEGIDGISYRDNGELKTIIFGSSIKYEKEKFIIVQDDRGKEVFVIEIPDDAAKSEETSQDVLQRRQSSKDLQLLRNKLSTSSNSSNSDSEKEKEASTTQQEIKSTTPISPKQSNLDNGTCFKRTIMGVSFVAFCIAIAYQYRKLPDAFSKFIDNFLAQCSNLMPTVFTR